MLLPRGCGRCRRGGGGLDSEAPQQAEDAVEEDDAGAGLDPGEVSAFDVGPFGELGLSSSPDVSCLGHHGTQVACGTHASGAVHVSHHAPPFVWISAHRAIRPSLCRYQHFVQDAVGVSMTTLLVRVVVGRGGRPCSTSRVNGGVAGRGGSCFDADASAVCR